ncbi:MAG: alpha/beta hydrolase-fold protein [Fusicatenibacter sp.]|nr:alpha/beta hydrolase-fold protein [Fusicatenibacter sp.]
MRREWISQYSENLNREMHFLVFGSSGVPLLAFPCQDGMCDNWESFGMPDTLADYIDSGKIQLFCADTVDRESWSDKFADKEQRALVQEAYYRYIVEEAVPLIHWKNGSDRKPIATGFSLGASHAAIIFFRRPDLFAGMLGCSGCYDTVHFWDGWCNHTLYDNSPVHFLANMPEDHPYIALYNQKKIAICVGQGRWEREGRRTAAIMRELFQQKGIHGWVDFWGYDVDHDWPWWKKQIRYFLPWLLNEKEG